MSQNAVWLCLPHYWCANFKARRKITMSIWLSIALISYLLGAVIQWLQFWPNFKELDEYSNFPIVWVVEVVSMFSCFIKALTWPYTLILDSLILDNECC